MTPLRHTKEAIRHAQPSDAAKHRPARPSETFRGDFRSPFRFPECTTATFLRLLL